MIPYATLGDMVENGACIDFHCMRGFADCGHFKFPMERLIGIFGADFMPGQQKDELLRAARCPNCGRCDAVVTRLGLVAHSDAGKIGFDGHRHRFERRPAPEQAAEPAAASRPWPKRRRHRREARLQP